MPNSFKKQVLIKDVKNSTKKEIDKLLAKKKELTRSESKRLNMHIRNVENYNNEIRKDNNLPVIAPFLVPERSYFVTNKRYRNISPDKSKHLIIDCYVVDVVQLKKNLDKLDSKDYSLENEEKKMKLLSKIIYYQNRIRRVQNLFVLDKLNEEKFR